MTNEEKLLLAGQIIGSVMKLTTEEWQTFASETIDPLFRYHTYIREIAFLRRRFDKEYSKEIDPLIISSLYLAILEGDSSAVPPLIDYLKEKGRDDLADHVCGYVWLGNKIIEKYT